MSPAVYVQTNDATGNEVIAFSRTQDGARLAAAEVRIEGETLLVRAKRAFRSRYAHHEDSDHG